MIERGRHVFSIGRHYDVCERCLKGIRDAGGVSGLCSGEPLDERACQLVNASEGKGYAEGVKDAARLVRKAYEAHRWTSLYDLLVEIGDLAR